MSIFIIGILFNGIVSQIPNKVISFFVSIRRNIHCKFVVDFPCFSVLESGNNHVGNSKGSRYNP